MKAYESGAVISAPPDARGLKARVESRAAPPVAAVPSGSPTVNPA